MAQVWRHSLGDGVTAVELQTLHTPQLFAAVEANRAHLRRWLPWVDSVRSIEDSATWVANALREREENGALQVVLLEHGHKVLGVCGHHHIHWAHRRVALGYWLRAEATGRGLMTRTVAALLRHSFEEFALHRVEIYAATGNAASQAIPRRLGFRHEGTLRDAEWLYDHFVDLHLYAQLEDEWQATQANPSGGLPPSPGVAMSP